MENHERFCPKNPENKRPCFGCKFLTEIKTTYSKLVEDWSHNAGNIERSAKVIDVETKGFYCQKHHQEMYPPKIEILGYDMEEHKSPMPRQCQDFEEFNYLEI